MTQDDIAKLSPAERLSLISALWDSLADTDARLSQAQSDELLRRLADFEGDRLHAIPWDALKAEVIKRGP